MKARVPLPLLALLIGCVATVTAQLQQGPETPQANGKLQIHFIDVGEGDAAVLISPHGETVMFDAGGFKECDKPLAYLQQLGVGQLDYHIISHYHTDHIGCAAALYADVPVRHAVYDRGADYPGDLYESYVKAAGAKRQTATDQTTITLEKESASPVTVRIVALNANGMETDNEDGRSLVAVITFGTFKAVIGGDLTGYSENDHVDAETTAAPKVGRADVYKVHGHGNRYGSNKAWLSTVRPGIAIISTGAGNAFGHPARESMDRLHRAGVKTYWTGTGNGVQPEPGLDVIGENIIIEMDPNAKTYTVSTTARRQVVDEYPIAGVGNTPPVRPGVTYGWSKLSSIYHYASCSFVKNINKEHLETGTAPPAGKTLHSGCPQ